MPRGKSKVFKDGNGDAFPDDSQDNKPDSKLVETPIDEPVESEKVCDKGVDKPLPGIEMTEDGMNRIPDELHVSEQGDAPSDEKADRIKGMDRWVQQVDEQGNEYLVDKETGEVKFDDYVDPRDYGDKIETKREKRLDTELLEAFKSVTGRMTQTPTVKKDSQMIGRQDRRIEVFRDWQDRVQVKERIDQYKNPGDRLGESLKEGVGRVARKVRGH